MYTSTGFGWMRPSGDYGIIGASCKMQFDPNRPAKASGWKSAWNKTASLTADRLRALEEVDARHVPRLLLFLALYALGFWLLVISGASWLLGAL